MLSLFLYGSPKISKNNVFLVGVPRNKKKSLYILLFFSERVYHEKKIIYIFCYFLAKVKENTEVKKREPEPEQTESPVARLAKYVER